MYDLIRAFSFKTLDLRKVFYHANYIGVNSLSVVLLTGASVGSVLAWQTYIGLKRFGQYQYIGPVLFLGMVREFGPVLSAIMVTGRAGSAMTAEIGTMKISEQIDALKTLGIDVRHYLLIPRIIATTLTLPLLSLFCSLCGIIAGHTVVVSVLNVINHERFVSSIQSMVVMRDIFDGLFKSVIFGVLLSTIAVFKGFMTHGGARDVGRATTESVVAASLTVLVADYILTSLLSGG